MEKEYNEDLVGVVVTFDDGRTLNFQFESFQPSNHPQPDFFLAYGCAGDDTWREFSDEELAEASKFLRADPEIDELERAYTKAFYKGTLPAEFPIKKWEIMQASWKEP